MNKLVSLRLAVKESEILPSMKAKTDIDKKTEQVHQTVAESWKKGVSSMWKAWSWHSYLMG